MGKGIQAEIKQTKPFSSLEEEAFVAILRTADQLATKAGEVLKPHGLSPTQFNALRILRGAGPGGLACSEIGERMISHDPDITRLLNRLESRGLVERHRDEKDRRVIMARITPAGLDALKPLDRPLEQFHRELLKHMGKRQIESLIQLLDATRKSPLENHASKAKALHLRKSDNSRYNDILQNYRGDL